MSAIDEIAAERVRQIKTERWSAKHDDAHTDGSLARAAACYALGRRDVIGGCSLNHIARVDLWPWDWKWWKPKDQRRNLVRAGALIVAEIERLDRAASAEAA